MKFFDLQCWSYFVVIMLFMQPFCLSVPIPVAARSKAWVCGRLLAGIAGSNPSGAWMSVSCECCVLSGRGICVSLITRPDEMVWCVSLSVIVKSR